MADSSRTSRSSPLPPAALAMKGNFVRWIGAMFGVTALVMMIPALFAAVGQHIRLQSHVPTPATIVSSTEKRSSDGDGGETAEPVIVYRYTVRGHRYRSDVVFPAGKLSGDTDWADEIVAGYPPGKLTTAWYDPQSPADAFLNHAVDYRSFMNCLFPLPFIALGLFAWFGSAKAVIRTPMVLAGGWCRLAGGRSLGAQRAMFGIGVACWYGYIALAIGDYLYLNGWRVDRFAIIVLSAGGVIGLLGVVPLFRTWRLSRIYCDPELCIDRASIFPGETVVFRLRQDMLGSVEIESFQASMVCWVVDKRGEEITAKTEWSETVSGRPKDAVRSTQQWEAQGQWTIPAGASPTTPRSGKPYPNYHWYIVLIIEARDAFRFKVNFPIRVDSLFAAVPIIGSAADAAAGG